jgi:hypothetical protein
MPEFFLRQPGLRPEAREIRAEALRRVHSQESLPVDAIGLQGIVGRFLSSFRSMLLDRRWLTRRSSGARERLERSR